MESNPKAFDKAEQSSLDADELLQQYGVGSAPFAGAPDALYERRMKFDNVVELEVRQLARALQSRRPRGERHSFGALA